MVVQGKKSNYETDIFQDIIREISSITGKAYGINENGYRIAGCRRSSQSGFILNS